MNNSDDNGYYHVVVVDPLLPDYWGESASVDGYYHQHCFSLSFLIKQNNKQYILIFYLISVTHIV